MKPILSQTWSRCNVLGRSRYCSSGFSGNVLQLFFLRSRNKRWRQESVSVNLTSRGHQTCDWSITTIIRCWHCSCSHNLSPLQQKHFLTWTLVSAEGMRKMQRAAWLLWSKLWFPPTDTNNSFTLYSFWDTTFAVNKARLPEGARHEIMNNQQLPELLQLIMAL